MYILCTYHKDLGRRNYVAATKWLINKCLKDMYDLGPATQFPDFWRIFDANPSTRGWCASSHPDAYQHIHTVREGTTEILLGY